MPVVMVTAARTPFAPAGGVLAGWHPVDLLALTLNEVIRRGGLEPSAIDEVWVGCAEPVGAQGADVARAGVLAAGWPDQVGGSVVERGETSGTAALHAAAAAVASGAIRTAVVAGVCSASVVPPGASALGRTYGRPWGDAPAARVADRGGLLPPARAADVAAMAVGIGRDAQDETAHRSRRLRGEALAPATMTVPARPGEGMAVQRDTPVEADIAHPLPGTGNDDEAPLRPMFDDNGAVTALSFAAPADGVSAVLLTANGPGRAELIGTGRAAGDPLDPSGGVERAVEATGVDPAAVDRWEIVEPTAAGLLLVCRRLDLDPTTVNIDGGTLGVGDAGAAEELRLSVDGVGASAPDELVATVATGPTGSAVTVWRRTARG